jgi:hypothetical protein
MSDQTEDVLQGQETPAPDSQSQNGSQIDAADNASQSEEEVEFNKLTGSTQDRIRKLVHDKRDLLDEVDTYKSTLRTIPPPPPQDNQPNLDVQQAVRKLSDVGIATKEDVQNMVTGTVQTLRYEQEMQRLASAYTGKNNEPQFDRTEYEEFVRENPVYANYYPEDVFKDKMFRDEFHNGVVENASVPQTLKPTRTSQQKETFTPEYIEEKLKSLPVDERNKWYSENLNEINATLGKMTPQS